MIQFKKFELNTKKLYCISGVRPVALNVVVLLRCTTVPLPNASPVIYFVASTGLAPSEADKDLTTKYWSALVAVNEPAILVDVVAPKIKVVGWVTGAAQGGKPAKVVAFPLRTGLVKYLGPPVQIAFSGKTKK